MKIDIVITWVDGNDISWKQEKIKYLKASGLAAMSESQDARYREWDNTQYIFRGIEKFMPWVNKIHFVTYGHLPKWLNTAHSKLIIVNHKDFIPLEYLPTFNSNTIELNLHKIPHLSEHFINFNDDMFVIAPTKQDDFFSYGKPKDMACISPQPIQRSAIANIELNNLKIINQYFTKQDILNHAWKWLNPFLYGQFAIRTAIFLQFKTIIGIFQPHIPFSYLKSIGEEVWEKEFDTLNNVCKNKFRSSEDVNEWLFRSWQLLSGNFVPRNSKFGLLLDASRVTDIQTILKHPGKCKMICINDSPSVQNFEETKNAVNCFLQDLLPQKSSFEI